MRLRRHYRVFASFFVPYIFLVLIIGYGGSVVISLKDIEARSIQTEYSWEKLHTSTILRFSQVRHQHDGKQWQNNINDFEDSLERLRMSRGRMFLGDELQDRLRRSEDVWSVTKKKLLLSESLYMEIRELEGNETGDDGEPDAGEWMQYRLDDSLTDFDVSGDVFKDSLSQITDEIRTRVISMIDVIVLTTLTVSTFIMYVAYAVSRRSEEAVRTQVEQLEEMDRMKDDFLRNITHEIKSPIVPLRGYLEVLLKRTYGELTEKQEEVLDTCLRNASKLNHLMSDLVQLTKLESNRGNYDMRENDINEVVDEVVKRMSMMVVEGGLEMSWDKGAPMLVKCDREKIDSVLDNLLNNAVKFTQEGGITVKTSDEGDFVQVRVEDTGVGISEEYLGRVFDKLFQVDTGTSRKHEGTGLGLSIAKRIVEDHGGRIWVESEYGAGSAFIFTLPKKTI